MNKGDFVKINYVGRLESGEIFDLTRGDVARKEGVYNSKITYRPVVIVLGAGFVIKGLENALLKMSAGEKKTVEVEFKDGFGERDPSLVKIFPKKHFKNPEQGMVVDMNGIRGRIQSVTAGRVRVDFNNPLAGKKLIYELEVIEVLKTSGEKINSLFEFFGLTLPEISIEGADVILKKVDIHSQLKERISKIMFENIKLDGSKNIEKISFVDEYHKSFSADK